MLTGKPEVLFRHQPERKKKVSVILLDWNVRESFHSLDYLNRQTTPRDDYELIWVEFYQRIAEPLKGMTGSSVRPLLDQWIVLGYPPDLLYHKHRAYNAGLLAATGDICVICDSDAMFRPTFIENVIRAFDEPNVVAVHLDEVRNFDKQYYPFNYPTFEAVTGSGAVNWNGKTTLGLATEEDRLHRAKLRRCLAARRNDLLAIGGADEHLDYLGYCCGPYDLTFRLLNRGGRERWLADEFLYHTWHPNQTSMNSDYSGPHDGRYMSLLALHARASGRVLPYLENPCMRIENDNERFGEFLRYVAKHPETAWRAESPPALPTDFAYCVENNYRGFDLFMYRNEWCACPMGQEFDRARASTLHAKTELGIRGLVISERPRRRPEVRGQESGVRSQEPGVRGQKSEVGSQMSGVVAKPEVLLRHQSGRKKVSVILTDWNACESFHSLEYLNRQTVARDDYELIWVEFYDRQADPIRRMLASSERPMLDQWIVLGYPANGPVHRHRAYNAGLLAATGDICVFCDADAMVRPTFIENLLRAFDETAYAAVHVDVVRNLDARFYPFHYPTFEEVMGPGCVNWLGGTTVGLWSEEDRLHRADYAACLAARRSDLLAIGGADEHADYLGSSSGPYEMTFRLLNRGRRERWLTNEYLYRTWRPEPNACDASVSGPHDGRDLSLRALHARASGQVRPYVENPCVRHGNHTDRFAAFLRYVAEHPETDWQAAASTSDFVYRVDTDFRGYDLFVCRGEWYACPTGRGFDIARNDTLICEDEESIRLLVTAKSPNHCGKRRPTKIKRFMRNLLAEPLHCLPRRALRVAGRVLKKAR